MLVPFTYTHVEYEAGDALGRAAALASLAPIFFVVALATSLAQRRDLGTAALLAGQLANEVLNTALKRALRAPRPTSLHPHAVACGYQLFDGLGRGGNAGFARYGFGGYANLHG